MLCQFTFKNFKSYKSETTFDFQATAIPEFADDIISGGKGTDLLPVGVVYGPNGGGKTSLLQALSCLITTVVSPVFEMEKCRNESVIQFRVDYSPFAFDEESRQEPTSFDIFFRQGENEYRYFLSLYNDKIVSEALYWRAIGGKKTGTVFEREADEISLGASIKKSSISRSVNPKMPYLSFLAINYNIPVIAEVQQWFESCIILNYANPVAERKIMVSDDSDMQQLIILALNDMGIDLSGFRYDNDEKKLYTQRTIDGHSYELQYKDESEGTRKIISALPMFILALQEGRLVVIDELDAKLHPKLLRYIIGMFKNRKINTAGAQLIFTSHDLTTMKNTVFRRDEIWFAAMNDRHESEIYSLYEIRREDSERVNNTAAYDKQYLEGRYGADPYLSNMLAGSEWK